MRGHDDIVFFHIQEASYVGSIFICSTSIPVPFILDFDPFTGHALIEEDAELLFQVCRDIIWVN